MSMLLNLVVFCGVPASVAIGRTTMVAVGSVLIAPVAVLAVTEMEFDPTCIERTSKVQMSPVTVAADMIVPAVLPTVTATTTESFSGVPSTTAPLIVCKVARVGEMTGFMLNVVIGTGVGGPPVAGRWISGEVPSGIKSSG